MAATIGFRPTDEDQRIIDAAMAATGETSGSAIIRRGLRLLEREVWLRSAREDAQSLSAEDLSAEQDAW